MVLKETGVYVTARSSISASRTGAERVGEIEMASANNVAKTLLPNIMTSRLGLES